MLVDAAGILGEEDEEGLAFWALGSGRDILRTQVSSSMIPTGRLPFEYSLQYPPERIKRSKIGFAMILRVWTLP